MMSGRTIVVPTRKILTLVVIVISAQLLVSVLCEEEHESQFPLRRQPPYYNAELYKVLRQHYKFRDFMWAGSGEGPVSSENQDGLAWEDDVSSAGHVEIKVTKTMVLYKTVLSTVYPVAMTPILVTTIIAASPTVHITIEPSQTLSEYISQELTLTSIIPTATLTPIIVQPTVTASPPPDSRTEEETSETLNDRLSAVNTDPRYWIQTSIRKRRDKYHPNDVEFHELLQNRLASIYATAFKRQLLKSLRLMGHYENNNKGHGSNATVEKKRNRRATFQNLDYGDDVDTNPLYFFLKGQSTVAKTIMNVSVSMINVTSTKGDVQCHLDDRKCQVDLKYIVYAEGNPVQGFIAVKELQAVTKPEMEKKLGYEIISKAEALVQPLERNEFGAVASTTPWLIALMVLVSLMILILALTMFMAWKWRYNRLRDRQDQSLGNAEGGLSNPPSTQSGQQVGRGRSTGENRRSVAESPPSRASSHGDERRSRGKTGTLEPSHGPPSERQSGRLVGGEEEGQYRPQSQEDRRSSSLLIDPGEVSSYHSHSPQRHAKPKVSGVARKLQKKRGQRRKTNIEFDEEPRVPSTVASEAEGGDEKADFGFTGEICRNMDKISVGNLEFYAETESRGSSAHSKKILSRPSSHEQKQAVAKPDKLETEADVHELERELSFDASEPEETETRDAEVQTPTRLKHRQSPRLRTSPRHRKAKASKMSLLSTESEEAVEFTNIPSSDLEENPIGRIRKRFHQFLDDAFNVMTHGRKETQGKCPQSAKVTVTHQMKTKPSGRPWTSHVIREESVRKIRPKSSKEAGLGPPKSAWAAGSERRVQSAKSKTSVIEEEVQEAGPDIFEPFESGQHHRQRDSSRSSSTQRTDCHQSFTEGGGSHAYVFPKYPAYPEVEDLEQDPNWASAVPRPGTSQMMGATSRLHPLDPAVPLIEAIKDEMKRFEKVKSSKDKP